MMSTTVLETCRGILVVNEIYQLLILVINELNAKYLVL